VAAELPLLSPIEAPGLKGKVAARTCYDEEFYIYLINFAA
jgi:hypothetical protein